MKLPTVSLLFTSALLCGAAAHAGPTVEWVRQIGTSSDDSSNAVAVDAAGSVYISGYTEGTLADTPAGDRDAFLTKFDSSGNEQWTKQIGTSGADASWSVAVDVVDNVYICGYTEGSLSSANSGGVDAFLVKFDSSGNEQWTKQIGTSSYDASYSVAVDAAGNAYISGTTGGSLEGIRLGSREAFLTKFDSSGNELWTEQIETDRTSWGSSVAIDAAGNAYISGHSLTGTGTYRDVFLMKFDSSGNELWSEQIQTSDWARSNSVAIDAAGNAYISGFSNGSPSGDSEGVGVAFLTKFSSSGNELWTRQMGATGFYQSYSVAIDATGNAYVSGFDGGTLGYLLLGRADAFLTKFDSSGNELWTEQIGSSSVDGSFSVAVDAAGYAYISGRTFGSLVGANAGGWDAFLVRYRVVPEPRAAVLAAMAGMAVLAVRPRVIPTGRGGRVNSPAIYRGATARLAANSVPSVTAVANPNAHRGGVARRLLSP